MSRSYKKNPYTKLKMLDGKNFAKRKVRQFYKDKDFLGNGAYDKRLYDQYDVVDWRSCAPSFEEFCTWYPEEENIKVLKREYKKTWINK